MVGANINYAIQLLSRNSLLWSDHSQLKNEIFELNEGQVLCYLLGPGFQYTKFTHNHARLFQFSLLAQLFNSAFFVEGIKSVFNCN